jgi:hypothetical protein
MALSMAVVGGAIAVLAGLISYLCLYAFIVIRTSGSTPSRRRDPDADAHAGKLRRTRRPAPRPRQRRRRRHPVPGVIAFITGEILHIDGGQIAGH